MKLINHIEFLLTRHDCVIVPGVGALLAHPVPAYYDEDLSRWFPPVRVISFNPEITRTDGLLASSLARRERLSMNSAAAIVRSETEKMKQALESERSLSFGDAGFLVMTSDGRKIFTPGSMAWISPSSMWLPSFEVGLAAKDETNAEQRIAAVKRRIRRNETFRKVASIAACVLVLFALGWIVTKNLSFSSAQFASILPVESIAEADIDGTFVGVIDDSPACVVLSQEPAVEEIDTPSVQPEAKYLLIVASLSSEEEAQRFIRQYPQLPLMMVCDEGRYRVAAAWGNSWDTVAMAADMPEIADTFASSWVYIR